MEYDSNNVMAYIIGRCADENIFVNLTKLQKLLYCCYGVVLAKFDERLTKEHPQAWQYGPVFPRTINALNKGRIRQDEDGDFSKKCSKEILDTINATIKFFGKFKATELSTWSHKSGSSWDFATDSGQVLPAQMDDFQMAKYFREKVLRG